MGVWKPKKKVYWYYQFIIDGQRYTGSTKQTSKRAAERVFHAERSRVEKCLVDGTLGKKKIMTIDMAAEKYFTQHASFLKQSKDIEYQLEKLIIGIGAETTMDAVTTATLLELQAKIRGENTRYNKPPAPRSVNAIVPEMARKLWRFCHEMLDIKLADEPNWSKLTLETPEERVRELSYEEEDRLFKHLRQDYHPFFRFAIITGLRQSNLIKLTWSDIDMENGIMQVRGKSRKQDGKKITLPLTNSMKAILGACRGHHPIFVFTYICQRSNNGKRKGIRYPFKNKNTLKRSWASAKQQAGLTDFRFHDTRHTAATRTLRSSKNLKAVQKMLGHADITTTAKYAHVMVDDIKSAMETVDLQTINKLTPNTNPKRSASN